MQTTDPRAVLAAQLDAARLTTGKKVRASTILELLVTDRAARFIFWVAIDLALFLQAQGIEVKRQASDNRISTVLARLLAAEDAAREAVHGRCWTERESTVYLLARILGEQPAAAEQPRRLVEVIAEVNPVAVH